MKLDGTLLDFMKTQARQSIRKNKLSKALSYYQRICNIEPDEPKSWWMLGTINGWMGHMLDAEDAYRKALELNPDYADAHCSLGNALYCQGKVEEAVASFHAALQINPSHSEAMNNLGTALHYLKRDDEAVSVYLNSLTNQPTAMSYYNLANTLGRQGRFLEAIENYEKALAVHAGFFPAHNNVGLVLLNLGRLEEAENHYRLALRKKPDFMTTHYNLGNVLELQGRLDEAMECYKEASRLRQELQQRTHIKAAAGQASILEKQGRYEEAYSILKPLLDEKITQPIVAIVFAALCRHVGRCEEAIALARRALEGMDETRRDTERERITLHFALGRMLDAAGAYDDAFDYYQRGNGLKGAQYDRRAHERYVDALITVFSPEFVSSAPRAANASSRPVFIVGMPRSGTSLVEQILASHPDVCAGGEQQHVPRLAASLAQRLSVTTPYPACVTLLTEASCNELAASYYDQLVLLSETARYVTDKMPTNFLHLGLINLLFPGARIIHCTRDPLDTCLSCYFQDFVGTDNIYSYDLEDLGHYYGQYRRLMDHWKTVLDLPMLEVSYEGLINAQERETRALLDFCALSWDDRCLRFNETTRFSTTASYDQVRRPLYKDSVQRWRHYADHLEPLQQALNGCTT